jgi:hypothetical protein
VVLCSELQLLVTANVVPSWLILSTLMMEAIRSSETSVTSENTTFVNYVKLLFQNVRVRSKYNPLHISLRISRVRRSTRSQRGLSQYECIYFILSGFIAIFIARAMVVGLP